MRRELLLPLNPILRSWWLFRGGLLHRPLTMIRPDDQPLVSPLVFKRGFLSAVPHGCCFHARFWAQILGSDSLVPSSLGSSQRLCDTKQVDPLAVNVGICVTRYPSLEMVSVCHRTMPLRNPHPLDSRLESRLLIQECQTGCDRFNF
jgi:hypothetical protein